MVSAVDSIGLCHVQFTNTQFVGHSLDGFVWQFENRFYILQIYLSIHPQIANSPAAASPSVATIEIQTL